MTPRLLLVVLAFILGVLPASAHELRPVLLQITEAADGGYNVLWKRPQRGDRTLGLRVAWPENCELLAPPAAESVSGGVVERSLLACDGGLVGRQLGIDGLATSSADVLVRIDFLDGRIQTNLLRAAAPLVDVEGPRSSLAVAADYAVMGVEHILFGIDHLLFVLGLVLIVPSAALLMQTITAFTVAHSVTLAAATFGVVSVPQAPVEAIIALSILFLASELARRQRGDVGLTARHPWAVAFGFGLLHGLGFAGALAEVGLPEGDIPLALLAFNLGVEAGQLLFVALLFVLLQICRQVFTTAPRWAAALPAYAVGSVAAFWLIERVASFG